MCNARVDYYTQYTYIPLVCMCVGVCVVEGASSIECKFEQTQHTHTHTHTHTHYLRVIMQ